MGVGEGARSGEDEAIYFRVMPEFIVGKPVLSEEGDAIGRVSELVRSSDAYGVVRIEAGWVGVPHQVVVPLERFTVTERGLLLPSLTEDSVEQFDVYEGTDYVDIGQRYQTLGDLYGVGGGANAAEGEGLGAGEQTGAGALGRDPETLGITIEALYGANVIGANGDPIGELERIVRSTDLYAAIVSEGGWFDEATQIVVPLERLGLTEEGAFLLRGATQETAGELESYRTAEGGYGAGGYERR